MHSKCIGSTPEANEWSKFGLSICFKLSTCLSVWWIEAMNFYISLHEDFIVLSWDIFLKKKKVEEQWY